MLDNIYAFNRTTRTAPTGYEKVRLLFHGIRTMQLISSIIVGSIVFYFAWWLKHDKIKGGIPWTFIIVSTANTTHQPTMGQYADIVPSSSSAPSSPSSA